MRMVAALACCVSFRRGTAAGLRQRSIHTSKTPTTTIITTTTTSCLSRHLVVRTQTMSTFANSKIPPDTTTTFGVSPPLRIPYSLNILKLRQQVMWPDQPLEYSSVAGDEEKSTIHFGIYVTSPSSLSSSSSSSLLPTNTKVPTSVSSLEESNQSDKKRLCSVVSVWINEDGTDAQFRKFCTDTAWQGQGLGTSLLRYTFQELLGWNNSSNNKNNNNNCTTTTSTATTSPLRRICCNARVEQCHFYAKPPFDMMPIDGSEFVKGGRDYRLMERVNNAVVEVYSQD
jgi:hypothetical protein